jgi:serine/threonine protein kinase
VSAPPEARRKPPAPASGASAASSSSGIRALLEEAIAAQLAEEAAENGLDDSETEPEHTQRVSGDVVEAILAHAAAASLPPTESFDDETTTFAGMQRKPAPTVRPGALLPRPSPLPRARFVRPRPNPDEAPALRTAAPGPAAKKPAAAPVAARPAAVEPTPSMPPASAGARIGRYEIERRIAYGGMAEVLLAREPLSVGGSRRVAIKRVLPHVSDDESFVAMFLDEARIALLLQHPNVCACFDAGPSAEGPYLAMEYVEGRSLAQLITLAHGGGVLPVAVVARVISLVAEALHYAHGAVDADGAPLHVVHRDVSPSNILIGRDGRVKLLDFGVAKARSHATRTSAGVVKGKFAYMAPEQCRGSVADARADVFALGICLYEALTCTSLFSRENEYATMTAVLHEPPASPRSVDPRIPAELDAIVLRALAKDPDARFPTALAMQEALESWLASSRVAVHSARIATAVEQLVAGAPGVVDALLEPLSAPGTVSAVDADVGRENDPEEWRPSSPHPVSPDPTQAAPAGAAVFAPAPAVSTVFAAAPPTLPITEPFPDTRPGDARRRAPNPAPIVRPSADETAKIGAAGDDAPRHAGMRWLVLLALCAALGGLAYWFASR